MGRVFTLNIPVFLSVIQFAIKMFTELDKDLVLNAFLLHQTFFQRILMLT